MKGKAVEKLSQSPQQGLQASAAGILASGQRLEKADTIAYKHEDVE